jgi:hypothetical protein
MSLLVPPPTSSSPLYGPLCQVERGEADNKKLVSVGLGITLIDRPHGVVGARPPFCLAHVAGPGRLHAMCLPGWLCATPVVVAVRKVVCVCSDLPRVFLHL